MSYPMPRFELKLEDAGYPVNDAISASTRRKHFWLGIYVIDTEDGPLLARIVMDVKDNQLYARAALASPYTAAKEAQPLNAYAGRTMWKVEGLQEGEG